MAYRKVFAPLVAAALAILVHGQALADVVIAESTRYYAIQGRDGFEVSKAMLSGGARNISLRHAIAATSTRFRVGNADVAVENGRCVVKDVKIHLEIEYLYPRWDSKARASGAVRSAWDRFYTELLRHEQTHGRYAKETARMLEKELKRLKGSVALGCRDFAVKADRRFDQIAAQLKRKQLAFDASENRKTSKISKLQIALLKAK